MFLTSDLVFCNPALVLKATEEEFLHLPHVVCYGTEVFVYFCEYFIFISVIDRIPPAKPDSLPCYFKSAKKLFEIRPLSA